MNGMKLTPHKILDLAREKLNAKNDAVLAHMLGKEPSLISRVRNRQRPMSAELILAIHESADIPVGQIKAMLGQRG
jgi:hypothetical protein